MAETKDRCERCDSAEVRNRRGRKSAKETPERTDGLGNPLIDDALYYVQDARSFVGNCGSWWRPDGAGYCCSIDEAGTYTGADVAVMRGTDVPWPVEYVLQHTVRHVRVDLKAFDRSNYKPGER